MPFAQRAGTYPLLVVYDGGDFLQYAAAKSKTVLDNLIHRLDVAELVAVFLHPKDRLTEYANSAALVPGVLGLAGNAARADLGAKSW